MYTSKLIKLFLGAKLITLIFVLLSAYLFKPHCGNTELLVDEHEPLSRFDEVVKTVLSPLARWDSNYFIRIALEGYKYEQQHAFFPLFPLMLRAGAESLRFIPSLSSLSRVMIVGVFLSNVCHFLTMTNIFRLSLMLGADEHFAFLASSFVIISPAYAFLNAIYTESLFAFLCTTGMVAFYKRRRLLASIVWCLAGLTRSNGIMMAGLFFYDTWIHLVRRNLRTKRFLKNILYALLTMSGYVAFQAYGFQTFCKTGQGRPWCNNIVPDLYGFVQSNYWNVGLFRYYRIPQIPNFLIALPMIIICGSACCKYFSHDWKRTFTLCASAKSSKLTRDFLLQDTMFPHFVLLFVMLVYSVLVVHVQIMARLFSFMPLVYWSLAYLYHNGSLRIRKAILYYCLSFSLVISALFTNYYPPA